MWCIGDVHGCIFTLEKLVNKLPKNSKLIFVGDLVDRGNFAKEVIISAFSAITSICCSTMQEMQS